jgi:hypothetical protein
VRALFPGELRDFAARVAPELFEQVKAHLLTSGYCSDVWAAGARRAIGKLVCADFQPHVRDRRDILPR